MATKTLTLTDNQRAVLMTTVAHDDLIARPAPRVLGAARKRIFAPLIAAGVLAERPATEAEAALGWRRAPDGTAIVARLTQEGMRMLGIDPLPEPGTGTAAAPDDDALVVAISVVTTRAADAEGWAAFAAGHPELMASLHDALFARRPAPRAPRAGTKRERVIAMLRAPEGATIEQIAAETGWKTHTVRGFFAGLKKREGIVAAPAGQATRADGGKATLYRIAG